MDTPGARSAGGRAEIAGDLFRAALRVAWRFVRVPAFLVLAMLDPIVRVVLGTLAPLLLLTALF